MVLINYMEKEKQNEGSPLVEKRREKELKDLFARFFSPARFGGVFEGREEEIAGQIKEIFESGDIQGGIYKFINKERIFLGYLIFKNKNGEEKQKIIESIIGELNSLIDEYRNFLTEEIRRQSVKANPELRPEDDLERESAKILPFKKRVE